MAYTNPLKIANGLVLDFTTQAADPADNFLALNSDGELTQFSSVAASRVNGGGNLTESTSAVLTITGGTGAVLSSMSIRVLQAATGQSGYLSSTDWNTFNAKLGPALTTGRFLVGVANVATAVAPTGDVTFDTTGLFSITAGVIVNADINASAAIAFTKMEAFPGVNLVTATNGSGFVTTIAGFTTTIAGFLTGITSSVQAQLNAKDTQIVGLSAAGIATGPATNGYAITWDNGAAQWSLSPVGAGGSVTGPGSSTDNAIVRWNGTGGTSIQNSGLIISDTDDVTGVATITVGTSGLHLLDTNASHDLIVSVGTNLTADRTLTITTGDTDRTLTISGNATINDWFDQDVKSTANPLFASVTVSNASGLHILDADDSHDLIFRTTSDLTADRELIFVTGDATRTLTINASGTLYVTGGTDVSVADGGTGISSYAVGDILYASGATTLSKLADVATGNALISGGITTAPSWGKVGLTTHISGTLAVGNGGTGVTTLAAKSIWLANTLDTITSVTPGAGQSIRINAGNTAWEAYTPSGGIGGSTGSTDNAMLRADGAGGSTVQASSVIVDDSANIILGTVSITGSRLISAINTAGNAALSFNAESQFIFERASGASADFGLLNLQLGQNRYSNTAADSGYFQFARFRGTTSGSGAVINNGDTLGQLKFAGYDGATGPMNGAIIKGISNGTVASGSVPTDLLFMTGSGGALDVNTIERLRLTSDGRFYGTALHNNAGAVTGTTNQYLASGTYTPTLTNVTNVAASTAYLCQWIRVGNVVVVSGKVDIDATLAASTATELGISLPIASALTAEQQVGGDAVSDSIASLSARIRADATNDRAAVVFKAISLTNDSYSFQFTYLIL